MFRFKTFSITPARRRTSAFVIVAMALGLVAVTSSTASADFDTVTSLTASNPAASENRLGDVSCVSTSFCMSVVEGRQTSGMSASKESFLTKWDGSSWSVVSTSGWPTNFGANDIACGSTSSCLVTGSVDTLNGQNLEMTPYLMLWNGSTVSQVTLPNVVYTLNAVSCASATFCLVVGSSSETPRKTLVLRWDGSSLTRETSGLFTNGTNNEVMLDVDCDTSRRCVGVTSIEINPSISAYDGEILDRGAVAGTWSRLSGRTDTLGQLQTVDCQPGELGLCAVLGSITNGTGAVIYDLGADLANKFRNVTLPVMPSGGLTNALQGKKITCATTTRCLLTGGFMVEMPKVDSYVGVWDGSAWTRLTSSSGAGGADIYDINCPTVSQCVAVGTSKATSGMMAPNSAASWFIRDAAQVAAPGVGSAPTTTAPSTTSPTVSAPSTTVSSSVTTTSPTSVVTATSLSATTTTVPAPALSIVKALPKAPKPIVAEASIATSEAISVSFGGFKPFEYVQLIVASTPKVIGSGYANAQGVVTIIGTLPNSLSSGSHTLAVYAPKSGIGFSQAFTVSQAKLPATGFDVMPLLIVLAILLLVGYLSLRRARSTTAI